MIERPASAEPFTAWVPPETAIPVLYFKDAARAAVELAAAALGDVTSANYLVDGAVPTPSAGELADAVTSAIPDARITFEPDPKITPFLTHVRAIHDISRPHRLGLDPSVQPGIDGRRLHP